MTAPARHADAQVESPNALALYNRKELAVFTAPEARALLSPMLGSGVTFEQVLSELYFAIQKNSAIAKCTPTSQLQAVARCLSWGLTIGDKAHLVPFKGTLTAVIDYKGAIDLVVQAGGARSIEAHWVYDDEHFKFKLGSGAYVDHIPSLASRAEKKIVGGYAVAFTSAHIPPKIVVMGVDEINKIRAKSQSWWDKKQNGNVVGSYTLEEIPWYVAKTCVRQIIKQLPSTPRLRSAAQHIETEETVVTDYSIEDVAGNAPSAAQADPHVERPDPANNSPVGSGPDANGAVAEPGDGPRKGPPCPKCGAAMRDDTVTKTNVKAPDYQCVAIVGDEKASGQCDGKYWPGQWPPKPPATDEQRAELGRLSAEAARLGMKKVTIDAVNRKVADPDLKTHHADQHIKALSEKIAEFKKTLADKEKLEEFKKTGEMDSSPATKGKF
jgi:phage RecT family recombinase